MAEDPPPHRNNYELGTRPFDASKSACQNPPHLLLQELVSAQRLGLQEGLSG